MRKIELIRNDNGYDTTFSITIDGRKLQCVWHKILALELKSIHIEVEILRAIIHEMDYELECNNEPKLSDDEKIAFLSAISETSNKF